MDLLNLNALGQAFAHCPRFRTTGSLDFIEPGPYFSSSVAVHPLRTALDPKLGGLLSRQLSNPPCRTNPRRRSPFAPALIAHFYLAVNDNLMGRFRLYTHPDAAPNLIRLVWY